MLYFSEYITVQANLKPTTHKLWYVLKFNNGNRITKKALMESIEVGCYKTLFKHMDILKKKGLLRIDDKDGKIRYVAIDPSLPDELNEPYVEEVEETPPKGLEKHFEKLEEATMPKPTFKPVASL